MALSIKYSNSNQPLHPDDDGQLFILVAAQGKTRLGRYLQSSARYPFAASTATGIHEYFSFDAFRAAYVAPESDKSKIRKLAHVEVQQWVSNLSHLLVNPDRSMQSAFANAWCDRLSTPLPTGENDPKPEWFLTDLNLLTAGQRAQIVTAHDELLERTGLPASFATMLLCANLDIHHGEVRDRDTVIEDSFEWHYSSGYEMAEYRIVGKRTFAPRSRATKRLT